MGHYDSCYEAEAEERYEKRCNEASERLQAIAESELGVEDQELLIAIADNIDDFRAMFRLIGNKKFRNL